jgi:hypothetical protein
MNFQLIMFRLYTQNKKEFVVKSDQYLFKSWNIYLYKV